MVSGHPDYQTYTGPAIGGSKINVHTFSGGIASGITGTVDIAVIPTGEQHSYIKIHVGCEYDDAIHDISLVRISDDWGLFVGKFVGSGEFDLIIDPQNAGAQVRIMITNNSANARTFKGSLSWVIREL